MPAERPPEPVRPLADRVRPASLRAIAGNGGALAELARWADAWANSRGAPPSPRAVLLEGPPGVGKTTAALAVAADHGWTVVELNASDARNETAVEQIAGRASLAHTLGTSGEYRAADDGGRTLILLDEADCLTGRRTEASAAPKPAKVPLRQFLRDRYGTVAALAKSWGLGVAGAPPAFEAWNDVPATAGRAAWTKLRAAQADLQDWQGVQKPRDRSDRGGLGAIAQLVRTTRQPVVLTVNDSSPLLRYSPVFRSPSVARLRFGWIPPTEVRAVLQRTAEREQWTVSPEAVEAIVRRSGGDLRGALNDLEAIHLLPPGPFPLGPLTGRDRIEELESLTRETLSGGRFYRSVEIRERLDATPDDLFPWIEENLPRFAASATARSLGFDRLARAEHLLSRARRQRVFALWSFAQEIMTGGVGILLADQGGAAATRTFFPQFLSDMGRTRIQRGLRDGVALKAGHFAHLSRRKAREEMLPFLERWSRPTGSGAGMAAAPARQRLLKRLLELDPAELAFLTGLDEAQFEETPEAEPEAPVELPASPGPPSPPIARTPGTAKRAQRRLGDFAG